MGEHRRKADGRRVFSTEFKRTAVQRIVTGEKTLAELSRELDISPSVIRNWKRFAEAGRRRPSRPVRMSSPPVSCGRRTPRSGNSSAPSAVRPCRSYPLASAEPPGEPSPQIMRRGPIVLLAPRGVAGADRLSPATPDTHSALPTHHRASEDGSRLDDRARGGGWLLDLARS
jgi:transposase-like protein